MDQHVYIVVSQTGTLVSRIIRLVTKAEYNHASISLTPDLEVMYSFGRKYAYNPIWAGFVTESRQHGFFKRFPKTRVIVLDVTVTQEQYQQIQNRIETISAHRHYYHYNYLGLCLAAFRIHYRHKRSYYCSEFVNHLLARCDVQGAKDANTIVHPTHFLSLPEVQQVYNGRLTDYGRFAAMNFRKRQIAC